MRLACGDSSVDFDFPEERVFCTLTSKETDTGAVRPVTELVEEAMDAPIGSKRLEEIVQPGETVCILVSDVTRLWQHTAEYMPMLVNRLNACGVPDENILVIAAVGTHRKQKEEEFPLLVGEEIYRRVRVINHDCDDTEHLRLVGETSRGNKVYLNSYAMDCDRLILTGGAVLHFIAGYGGGAKSIIPGIASRDTVNYNHNFALNPGFGNGIHPNVHSGCAVGNPLREDIDEGAAFAGVDFIVNVVANEKGEVIKAFAGELYQAHRAACDFTEQLFAVDVEKRVPMVIVSAGGYPKDINLRQTSKALHNALFVVEKGGTIVLFAECRDHFGDEQCREQVMDFVDMHQREAELRKHFTIGGFIGFYFSSAAEDHHLILVTSMPKEWFKNTNVHVVSSAAEALALAKTLNGDAFDTMEAVVLPGGGSVLPIVKNS